MPSPLRRAIAAGVLLAMVPLTWLLFGGRAELADEADTRNFYDEQVRAWFHGHWSMSSRVLFYEAWKGPNGRQMYFGPLPALLRVPALGVAELFGWAAMGRLTQPYMLGALLLLLVGVGVAWWRIRTMVRGDDPSTVTGGELLTAAASVVVVGLGTVITYLMGFPSVYREAILLGAALSFWALLKLTDVARYARPRDAAWAGLFSVAALNTRAAVGIGPLIATGLLGGAWLTVRCWPRLRRSLAEALAPGLHVDDRRRHDRVLLWLALSIVLALATFAAVNYVRFGTWFNLPLEQYEAGKLFGQKFIDTVTPEYKLFRLGFVPTNLRAYLQLGGLSMGGLPPWVRITMPELVGSTPPLPELSEPTGSITSTMPILVTLGLLGAVMVAWPGRRRSLTALRAVAVAATVPCVIGLLFMTTAHRYLGDWVPLLVLLGLVGLHALTGYFAQPRTWMRRVAGVLAVTVAALLAAWGCFVNGAIALEYQRLVRPFTPAMRYEFVRWQQWTEGYRRRVTPTDQLLTPGPEGTLAIVGNCRALAWSNGLGWTIIEGSVRDRNLPEGTVPGPPWTFLQSPLRSGRPADLCWKVERKASD